METFAAHKAGCYGTANVVPDPPEPSPLMGVGDPRLHDGVRNSPPDPLLAALAEAGMRDHRGSLQYLRDRDRMAHLEGASVYVGDGTPEGWRKLGTAGEAWRKLGTAGKVDPPETEGDAYDRILRAGSGIGHTDLDLTGEPPAVYVQPVTKALRDARAYHAAMRQEQAPPLRAARKALVGLVGALLRGRFWRRR